MHNLRPHKRRYLKPNSYPTYYLNDIRPRMVEASLVNMVEAIGILVGVVIALIQLRDMGKTREAELETRQAQLYMNIYARFTDKEFLDMVNEIRQFDYIDFDDFEKKYGQYDRNKIYAVAAVFEGIGVLVKRGLIDIRLVNDLMPLTIMSVWEKLEPILVEARSSDWGSRYAYKGFQYLHNAVVDTYEQQLRDWDT